MNKFGDLTKFRHHVHPMANFCQICHCRCCMHFGKLWNIHVTSMTFTLTSWPVSLQEKRALIMFEFGKLIFSIFLESSVESPRALVSNQKATLHL